jgi:hypothetical protein
MRLISRVSIAALAAATLAPAYNAEGREPGSALVYPVHSSRNGFHTIVSVTNTKMDDSGGVFPIAGGTTDILYQYINVSEGSYDPAKLPTISCFKTDRVERLTRGDILAVATSWHNAAQQRGYLVVCAIDPTLFKTPWSWNYLIGSETVVTSMGGVYDINAIPFKAMAATRTATDSDADGLKDFDGTEYEKIPNRIYIDNFVAAANSSMSLINMSGGQQWTATALIDLWNDNEQQLSFSQTFKCWFEANLTDVDLNFSQNFLLNNTPNDPDELNIDNTPNALGQLQDLETGWAVIDGNGGAFSTQGFIADVPLLGSITSGPSFGIDGGRLMWESSDDNADLGQFFYQSPLTP